MLDLVEKYFRSELTEAEQQRLSEALLESEEAALIFESKAQQTYQAFGLPEPHAHWTDGGPGAPPSGGWGGWFWTGMFALAVGMGALFWHLHQASALSNGMPLPGAREIADRKDLSGPVGTSQERSKKSREAVRSVAPEPGTSAGKGDHDDKESRATGYPSEQVLSGQRVPAASDMSRKDHVPPPSSRVQDPAVPGHSTGPVNLDQDPGKTFSVLSVVVSQAKSGPLRVQVLDTAGNLVAPLYDGTLGPGNWVFEWNGQFLGGNAAPSGFYRIEVRSGPFVQYKKIQIQ